MVLQEDVVKREGERRQRLLALAGLQLAFPDGDAMPAHLGQLLLLTLVTGLVALNLLRPEVDIGLRHAEIAASLMTMPEAAIDKDAATIPPQHKVRVSRQATVVKAVAEALPPQITPHNHLRLRVLGSDCRHVVVPLLADDCHILTVISTLQI